MSDNNTVHFTWYGEINEHTVNNATHGPCSYSKAFPEQTFVFYCQEEQISNVKYELKKLGNHNLIVKSIESILGEFAVKEPGLCSSIKAILQEVDEAGGYQNLGKEFIQLIVMYLYGGYHLDTTVFPSRPESTHLVKEGLRSAPILCTSNSASLGSLVSPLLETTDLGPTSTPFEEPVISGAQYFIDCQTKFLHHPHAILFGGIGSSSADIWAMYRPIDNDIYQDAYKQGIISLLSCIDRLKELSGSKTLSSVMSAIASGSLRTPKNPIVSAIASIADNIEEVMNRRQLMYRIDRGTMRRNNDDKYFHIVVHQFCGTKYFGRTSWRTGPCKSADTATCLTLPRRARLTS